MMMNSKYKPLFEKVTFPNGQTINNRFAMSPMVINSSNSDGSVTQDDIDYFQRRSKTGSMLITAACYTDKIEQWLDNQYGIFADYQIPGMKKMAGAMKSNGAKAIMQIYLPGREATVGYRDYGVAYGPSSMKVSFLDYPITGMSERKIHDVIKSCGAATKRAIEAGFDGVEVHGANHYLIQQFFSEFSNHREDKWGGSLENRARFGLAILDEVKRVAATEANRDFIVGYRISPEEIHGENVGYTFDDTLYMVKQLLKHGVDYIHSSLWGHDGYKLKARAGQHKNEAMNLVLKKEIDGQCPLMVVGDINSPEKALDALRYGDLVARGASAIVEPDMAEKIENGEADKVTMDIKGRVEELKIPAGVQTVRWILESSGSVTTEDLDEIDKLPLPSYYKPIAGKRQFDNK